MLSDVQAIAGAGAIVCTLLALIPFCIKIRMQLDAREAQQRQTELAGLKASHTDPRREIVV